ncbi:MAG: ATP-binding protein [Mogibacterium sp.]|nr:ATP-binding protein [Prevotella sp.]MBQ6440933.1 ATP-binding protein [Mogibacterium sp.]
MINEETKRKLRLMNIGEFIEASEEQEQDVNALALSFDDRFQMMVDSVYQQKYNDKVHNLIKRAHLRLPKADIHNVFYHEKRTLSRGVIDELATGKYIDENQSIILQGYTSTGKTYLGCALAKEACRQLHRTRYIRVPDMLTEYADKSLLPGGKEKVLRKYSGFKVLVLDEWLLSDLSKDEIEFLFELFERRFDISSTIFCTLYRTEDWLKRLGSGAYAESIVERYEHNSIRIETGSMNMRDIFANDR